MELRGAGPGGADAGLAHLDRFESESIHIIREGAAAFRNPAMLYSIGKDSSVMLALALKQALDACGFDAALGGARRDEEKLRGRERVFPLHGKAHRWDPKNRRPDLRDLYNASIAPLCFSAPRPVLRRDGIPVVVDDDRLPLAPGGRIVETLVPAPHPGLPAADRRGRSRGGHRA